MDTNNSIITKIQQIDVSHIEGVRFFQNDGKSYSVSLESIKKITFYILDKYEKVKFGPGELSHERDELLKNYKPTLSSEDYDGLVNAISNWVDVGGKFEIINSKPSKYGILGAILLFLVYAPFGFFLFALSAMIFDAPGSDRLLSNWIIFGVFNLVPLSIVVYAMKRFLK